MVSRYKSYRYLETIAMHIHTVSITVPDPVETARFLREVLELSGTATDDTAQIEVGTSTLILEQGDAEPGGYYHLAFEIPENTIHAATDLLLGRTPVLRSGNEAIKTASEEWNSHSVYFNAPGNLNLELIARHRQQNAISTPFTFANIQYISEVGIPVEDTDRAIREVKATFGLDPFTTPSANFAPVGTDDGLLILVREGRIWYPTEDQATTSRPLTITIEGAPKGAEATIALTPNVMVQGRDS